MFQEMQNKKKVQAKTKEEKRRKARAKEREKLTLYSGLCWILRSVLIIQLNCACVDRVTFNIYGVLFRFL